MEGKAKMSGNWLQSGNCFVSLNWDKRWQVKLLPVLNYFKLLCVVASPRHSTTLKMKEVMIVL